MRRFPSQQAAGWARLLCRKRRGKIRVDCAESFVRAGGREARGCLPEDMPGGLGWPGYTSGRRSRPCGCAR